MSFPSLFYFAGSSEMFGRVAEVPQTKTRRFHPRSAYEISKVAGFDLTRNYREACGIHAPRIRARDARDYVWYCPDTDKYIVRDPEFYRPAEAQLLIGSPAKAQAKLGVSEIILVGGLSG